MVKLRIEPGFNNRVHKVFLDDKQVDGTRLKRITIDLPAGELPEVHLIYGGLEIEVDDLEDVNVKHSREWAAPYVNGRGSGKYMDHVKRYLEDTALHHHQVDIMNDIALHGESMEAPTMSSVPLSKEDFTSNDEPISRKVYLLSKTFDELTDEERGEAWDDYGLTQMDFEKPTYLGYKLKHNNPYVEEVISQYSGDMYKALLILKQNGYIVDKTITVPKSYEKLWDGLDGVIFE